MNILIISTTIGLFKPKSGARARFYNLAKELDKKNQVYILQPSLFKDKKDCEFKNVSYFNSKNGSLTDLNPFFVLNALKLLKQKKIDIVQISHPFGILIMKILKIILRKNFKITLDAQDVLAEAVKIHDYSTKNESILNKIFTKIYQFYVPIIEKNGLKQSDYVLSVSEEDKKKFIELYHTNKKKIIVVPSGINLTIKTNKTTPTEKSRIIVMFHGSYAHPPNKEAINLIINFIAPQLKDISFLIAGYGVPIFETENIKSLGFVEDIYSILKKADLAIVPVLRGSGTRIKIMDYLLMGLPIVSTKKGIEGIEAKNNENAIIVEKVDKDFINAIKYLADNPKKRKSMGSSNISLINKYDYKHIGNNLNTFYNSIQ